LAVQESNQRAVKLGGDGDHKPISLLVLEDDFKLTIVKVDNKNENSTTTVMLRVNNIFSNFVN
jgi:hypothetical protein